MFKEYHPWVNLIFFVYAIGVTMLSTDPVFVLVTLIFAWSYSYSLKGKKSLKQNLLLTIPIVMIMTLINGIFVHNGATILFYISDLRITLEAVTYGFVSSMILCSVVIWFGCFSEIMTSDKLIFIFGKARPVLGLTFSMIFRFIPLLRERFHEIRMGQQAMGRNGDKSFFGKIRQFVKEISILISWSLESSIETADSMEARGYGLKGRTSFNLFTFDKRDASVLIIMIVLGSISLVSAISGNTDIYYYPVIIPNAPEPLWILALLSYVIYLSVPLLIDIRASFLWREA